MRHTEEASVAGESPDRSKQRESSAEPTPGSASPVPEARDPRLAVSRKGVDTATQVLSLPRDTARSAESDSEEPEQSEQSEELDGDTAPASAGSDDNDGASGSGDTRLRAAVAAWVRSGDAADEPEAEAAKADAESDAESEDEDKGEGEGSDKGEDEPVAAAQADSGADDDTDADDAEPEAAAETDDAEPEPEAEGGEGSDGEGSSEADQADDADDASPADADDEEAAQEQEPPAPDEADTPDTPEPPKRFVDQPTTMLKLGGAAKPKPKSPKADAASETNETSKADKAERPGKFVALKPLDPPPPAEATTQVPHVGPERTTQQPLPPKPPLDLLAELTNTPRPAETTVRTLVRRVKIWTPLVLLLAIVFAVVQSLRPLPAPTLALTADQTYQFDGGKVNLPWPTEGQGWMDGDGIGTMGTFGEQKPIAIGSVAKTMTAYVVLKDHPLKLGEEGPKITIDATAEKEGGYYKDNESTLNNVKKGDKLTLKQALSAIMIPSANNIARLLARWDAGSEAAFIKKMNATAKELGMTNTTYTDASGLKESTVSSAHDQVKLGNEVVEIPALVAITSAASWNDPHGKNHTNYNKLPFQIGAIGIKTGSTTKAGGNLLFASRKKVGGQTVTLVGAVLGQHKPDILETAIVASKAALLAAEDALTSKKIFKKGDVVGYVDDGLGGHTPVTVTKDVTAVGWAGVTVKLTFAAGKVPHTAKAGTKVGTLTIGDGKSGAVQVPVALQEDLAEPSLTGKLTRIS